LEGVFVDDKLDGYGIMYYSDGSKKYEGNWKRGNREGYGNFKYLKI